MRKLTKIKRSTRAISPIISVLLLVAIVVVASLVVYAWSIGYIGAKADVGDNALMACSYGNRDDFLTIYVQNIGIGQIHLKHDSSVYINGVLHQITQSPAGTPAAELIPIAEGQTVEIVTDYPFTAGEKVNIKIVTLEGNFIEQTQSLRTHKVFNPAQLPQNPAAEHKVSFTQTGSGSTVTVSYQIDGGAVQTGNMPFDAMVAEGSTITYTYAQTVGTTGTRYVLMNNPGSQQTMGTSDITVAGTYKTQYQVTFEVNPANSGTTTPSGSSNWYDAGQTGVSISATANTGYIFYSWSASPTSAITFTNPSSATTTITVGGPATVTAKMPILQTLTLNPNGKGLCTNLERYGGSDDNQNYKCVDDTSADGDSTYVYNGDSTSYSEDKYRLTDHGTATGNIVSVQVFMVCEKYGTGTQNSYAKTILLLNQRYYGNEVTLTASYTPYNSPAYTTTPEGNAWTWQNIDDMQAGISLKSGYVSCGSQSIARCTQVYAVVTYYNIP